MGPIPHLPFQIVGVAPIEGFSEEEAMLLRPTRLVEHLNIPISHYTPANRFLTLLESKNLYLSRLDSQRNDPEDGEWPQANMEEPQSLNQQFYSAFPTRRAPQVHLKEQRIDRQLSYIHCWFKGHKESAQMWKDFCYAGTGVCIRSTTTLLREALARGWPHDLIFQMHECLYTNSATQVPEFLPGVASARKDIRFENQQEIRVLAKVDVTKGPAPLPGPDCKRAPIDLSLLFERIILGPAILPEDEQRIREVLSELRLEVDVVNSSVRMG